MTKVIFKGNNNSEFCCLEIKVPMVLKNIGKNN